MANNSQGIKLLGYILLKPGLSKMNGATILFASVTGIPFLVVINFIQPYILTAMLDIPTAQHGSISGYLAIVHEIIMIVLTGPAGALADRIGRRRVMTVGFLLASVGLMIYPWALTITGLMFIRCLYAVGAAAMVSGISVFLADYPQEKSRGKLIAMAGVLNGVGILLLTATGGSLPKWLVAAGYEQIPAGRIAMALIGIIGLLSSLIIYFGFKNGDRGTQLQNSEPILKLLAQGFSAARNPRIAVSYASAFAARGDVVVIGTYVSLWGTQAGIADGLLEENALARATIIFATIQTAALIASPIIGIMNDRINRVTALIIGMGLAALGYILFGLQTTPLGSSAMGIAFILGIGQISAILAGTTLIGQEADPKITGATIGVWSFCGAVGTMIGSLLGGLLFDWWRPGAPFLLMGSLNLLVMIAAIYVRIRYRQEETLNIMATPADNPTESSTD
ncbi:MAG: MFS transporter [Gammaproteobacteria bacterium]|jgi:MFS family permease|nr:MFS transporter [Chromatiales bacterium]MDP6674123.1 MFS transporter [Gammaproteobacteria bacterium]